MKQEIFINEKRPHESGIKHVSGKAYYTDDIPEPSGTLYGAIGWSKKAHAIIKKINLDHFIKIYFFNYCMSFFTPSNSAE